jgi:hypothetical protein
MEMGWKRLPHRDLSGKKIRFGSEMCDMLHDLVEKMAKHSQSLDECSPTKARAECAPATRAGSR